MAAFAGLPTATTVCECMILHKCSSGWPSCACSTVQSCRTPRPRTSCSASSSSPSNGPTHSASRRCVLRSCRVRVCWSRRTPNPPIDRSAHPARSLDATGGPIGRHTAPLPALRVRRPGPPRLCQGTLRAARRPRGPLHTKRPLRLARVCVQDRERALLCSVPTRLSRTRRRASSSIDPSTLSACLSPVCRPDQPIHVPFSLTSLSPGRRPANPSRQARREVAGPLPQHPRALCGAGGGERPVAGGGAPDARALLLCGDAVLAVPADAVDAGPGGCSPGRHACLLSLHKQAGRRREGLSSPLLSLCKQASNGGNDGARRSVAVDRLPFHQCHH